MKQQRPKLRVRVELSERQALLVGGMLRAWILKNEKNNRGLSHSDSIKVIAKKIEQAVQVAKDERFQEAFRPDGINADLTAYYDI